MVCILDGKALALKICDNLKKEVEKYDKKPCLAVILANDNPASEIYVSSKEKKSKSIGFNSLVYKFDEKVKDIEIIELIEKLNKDNSVNGILVQLPLFGHLNQEKIISAIDYKKDVDGFHPVNIGKLSYGKPHSIPCTPKGIIKLLKEYDISLEGKNALVIGRSNIVGKPMAMLLINESATVVVANSKTKNLKELSSKMDIIISATGQEDMVTEDMVKEGAVVVDVGIIRQKDSKLRGDVDFENVKLRASYITPVPNGVGPMTIACLMENTFELFLEQNNLNAKF